MPFLLILLFLHLPFLPLLSIFFYLFFFLLFCLFFFNASTYSSSSSSTYSSGIFLLLLLCQPNLPHTPSRDHFLATLHQLPVPRCFSEAKAPDMDMDTLQFMWVWLVDSWTWGRSWTCSIPTLVPILFPPVSHPYISWNFFKIFLLCFKIRGWGGYEYNYCVLLLGNCAL